MEMRSTVAAIEPHLVHHPGGKHHQPSGSGLHPLGGAGRQAARHGDTETRRVHRRQRPARIHEFEFAAQRRIVRDAAVVDIVDGRPVGPGIGVVFVAVAGAIDVAHMLPCQGTAK